MVLCNSVLFQVSVYSTLFAVKVVSCLLDEFEGLLRKSLLTLLILQLIFTASKFLYFSVENGDSTHL